MNLFIISYYSSVFVQFICNLFQLYGVSLSVSSSLMPVKYALNIEFYVSVVEFIVYLWIGTNLSDFGSVMKKRYLDWFITTNFLMISISLMFMYFNQRQKREEQDRQENMKISNNKIENNLNELIFRHVYKFVPIILCNNLMLYVGYLGEKKMIQKKFSVSFGFLFFLLGFYLMYTSFAKYSRAGKFMFFVLTSIWALYGIAHTFSEEIKNTAYNLLDLVSKNLFGVFLVYILLNPNALSI